MPNILLIDDHAVVREGLKAILETEFRDIAVDEADTGNSGIMQIKEGVPAVVVLDISLPDMDGMEVLRRIRMEWPELPVLILSIYGEDQYGIRMMRLGASGYLVKSSAPENIIAALKTVISGQKYISHELAERLASNFDKTSGDISTECLSDRQYEIFRMLAAGKTVTEIAGELGLSVKTISSHRSHILKKMEMRNNADMVSYIHQAV